LAIIASTSVFDIGATVAADGADAGIAADIEDGPPDVTAPGADVVADAFGAPKIADTILPKMLMVSSVLEWPATKSKKTDGTA
jgi:hypothetical protein